jgi:endoglycosylceramidase
MLSVAGARANARQRTQLHQIRAGLSPLHVVRGPRPRIVDAQNRQVLLRGVNTNQLGDYYQAAALPATVPLTEDDATQMAALGFDAVRLIVHWSLLEPVRGQIDQAYLARVREAVSWFGRRGIYVVLDMHQDAWGKYIATPPGETCLPGFQPAIGWDGAPKWATLTDGLPTCRQQLRELSPAVGQAFHNFWTDRDGIQTELVRVWGVLARTFVTEPAVAGYDLLNEPHPGLTPGATDLVLLGNYYSAAIGAIREAEQTNVPGASQHMVFVEPMDTWSAAPVGVSPGPPFGADPQIVFAPHPYAGSITADRSLGVDLFTIPAEFDEAQREAARYETTFWSGEWGWFGDPVKDAAKVAEYARQEDLHLVGGAWWQWKQACGDPHSIGTPGGHAPAHTDSLVRLACPSNAPIGVPPAFAMVLSRAYPRAAPGELRAVTSVPATGELSLEGSTDVPGTLDVWVPARGPNKPTVQGTNVSAIRIVRVPGGYRVTARASGAYRLSLTR